MLVAASTDPRGARPLGCSSGCGQPRPRGCAVSRVYVRVAGHDGIVAVSSASLKVITVSRSGAVRDMGWCFSFVVDL